MLASNCATRCPCRLPRLHQRTVRWQEGGLAPEMKERGGQRGPPGLPRPRPDRSQSQRRSRFHGHSVGEPPPWAATIFASQANGTAGSPCLPAVRPLQAGDYESVDWRRPPDLSCREAWSQPTAQLETARAAEGCNGRRAHAGGGPDEYPLSGRKAVCAGVPRPARLRIPRTGSGGWQRLERQQLAGKDARLGVARKGRRFPPLCHLLEWPGLSRDEHQGRCRPPCRGNEYRPPVWPRFNAAIGEARSVFFTNTLSTRRLLLLRCGETEAALRSWAPVEQMMLRFQPTNRVPAAASGRIEDYDPYLELAGDWAWALFTGRFAPTCAAMKRSRWPRRASWPSAAED